MLMQPGHFGSPEQITPRKESWRRKGKEMSINYATSRSAWIGFALATTALFVPALAQQSQSSSESQGTLPQQPEKEKKEKLETVVVTGSNIRTDVSDVAALPLTIVTADDIAKQGPQELSQTLRENPSFSGGTLNGGSGGFFSGGVQTLNLLGLGDKYTLVLVDGRRFNSVTPTNIANIPTGAISSIQILTDGGSSIYGSDAVAGVVNILMDRKSYKGMEMSASYGDRVFGSNFGSQAWDLMTNAKFGASTDRARFSGDLQYSERGGTNLIDTWEGRYTNLSENQVYTSPSNVMLPPTEVTSSSTTTFSLKVHTAVTQRTTFHTIRTTTIRRSGRCNEQRYRIVRRRRFSLASVTPSTMSQIKSPCSARSTTPTPAQPNKTRNGA